MIKVPAGSFVMGSPESEAGHRVWERQREVTFEYDFFLGQTPVTQAQYESVTGTNPTDHDRNPDAPINSVWWEPAEKFCEKLTTLDREAGVLPDDWEYRLPTEAEWEYTCRAEVRSHAMASRRTSPGITRMLTGGLTLSARRLPTSGAFTTCSAISGSGARTGSGWPTPLGPFEAGATTTVLVAAVPPSEGDSDLPDATAVFEFLPLPLLSDQREQTS